MNTEPSKRRGIIKRDRVRLEGHAVAAEHSARAPSSAATVQRVRLLQLDEHTQAIEFTCPCGEVSLIEIQREKKP